MYKYSGSLSRINLKKYVAGQEPFTTKDRKVHEGILRSRDARSTTLRLRVSAVKILAMRTTEH
jgi:hypothetical protein